MGNSNPSPSVVTTVPDLMRSRTNLPLPEVRFSSCLCISALMPDSINMNFNQSPNVTRLDNRWVCSVGHASRNFNPPSPFNAHPCPSGASA